MSEIFYARIFFKSKLNSNPIYLFMITLIIQIKSESFYIQNACKYNKSYLNTSCFNDKIEFHENFRAGQFETFKDGSLIIEYSEEDSRNSNNSKRLFYGLKKNGRYYFPNESPFNHLKAYNPLNNGYTGRYESKNKIIYLSRDINREKGYLFSTSEYLTVTELHDIERNISNYWDTVSFWGNEIYSYIFEILNLPEDGENHYICVFNQRGGIFKDGKVYSQSFSLIKFKFDSFNNYAIINSVNYTNSYSCRIIIAFVVYEWQKIVIFFLKKVDDAFNQAQYSLAFYNYDLIKINEISRDSINDDSWGEGLFFSSLLIKNRLAAFLYFLDYYGRNIKFEVGELSDNLNNFYFNYRIEKNLSDYYFSSNINFNHFIKVDDKRLVFITSFSYGTLIFLLIDLYNNYYNYKIRLYYFNDIKEGFYREIQGYIFNGYLILTFSSQDNDIFSTLLFFGYANGTDFELDISLYLMDSSNYNPINNLYNKLIESCVIDNNIFGYELINKINLLYFPKEIWFFNGTGNTKENNILLNNSFFDENHTLYQNKELTKNNSLYFLEYQFIVKEPEFNNDTFYDIKIDDGSSYNFEEEFEPRIFYGRTNKLFFKLCHKYCLTCNEYGLSDTEPKDQKCLSCSENYTFDYWSYLKNGEFYCIPEGYYYVKEDKIIKECNTTSYKYFNASNDKIICFKSDYQCPPDYPYLNATTNECLPNPIKIQKINIKINNNKNISLILDEKIGEKTYQEYSGFPTDDSFSKFASLKYLKNNNNNIKGTTIDLGICENILKQTYHIPFEDSLYSLIIDIKQEGMKIPKVEYEIFDLNQDYNLIQLDLSVCK